MINPGQRVRIGGQVFRLRYITSHNFYTYYFEPGDTKLSPFRQNDVLIITLNKDQRFEWHVVQPCEKCNGTGEMDSGGTKPWGDQILVECDCGLEQEGE